MDTAAPFETQTELDTLRFDQRTGQLVSLRSKAAPDQEFIVAQASDPVFIIQYLDQDKRFRQITSHEAQTTRIEVERTSQGDLLIGTFEHLAGLEIDVTIKVRTDRQDRFSHWSLKLCNRTDTAIVDVQFPFVVVPYKLAGTPGSEAVLWPLQMGALRNPPRPEYYYPDCPHTWQLGRDKWDCLHYPGGLIAQFLAVYNDRAGLYISCQDDAGRIKMMLPAHHEPGLRLGIAHIGDWPTHGERTLEYDIVLGSFTGDWYAAAELYREWSLQQPWARTPLHKRQDVPAWLKNSPPHIMVRIQGELDAGPATPKEEFLPYRKLIPLLEPVAKRCKSPLVPVIMSWERGGPWVYPDCFPPVGGEESLREFAEMVRERGWHLGSFCNGTRWVFGHFWSNYDGWDYYLQNDGIKTICRLPNGEPWYTRWDEVWRPSFNSCLGALKTHEVAESFIRTLIDYGLDWIQFLDQNCHAVTFACYAHDHDHPPLPGYWMTEGMRRHLDSYKALAAETQARTNGERTLVFSVEGGPCECYLQDFQVCDIRVGPPPYLGTAAPPGSVPLYHFLYHEFIIIQGGFGGGHEPYHMPIRSAYNLVVGEIPGAVLKGDGTFLNVDTGNWAPWDRVVGSNEDALESLANVTAMRQGPAHDFLVFGRMQRPSQVDKIKTMRWENNSQVNAVPAVYHATWQAPDGRYGVVLANWTNDEQAAEIVEPRLGQQVMVHVVAAGGVASESCPGGGRISITLPPLGCALVEQMRTEAATPSSEHDEGVRALQQRSGAREGTDA